MVLELCDEGSLYDYILYGGNSDVRPRSVAQAKRIFLDVLLGMHYLSSKLMVHQDIKVRACCGYVDRCTAICIPRVRASHHRVAIDRPFWPPDPQPHPTTRRRTSPQIDNIYLSTIRDSSTGEPTYHEVRSFPCLFTTGRVLIKRAVRSAPVAALRDLLFLIDSPHHPQHITQQTNRTGASASWQNSATWAWLASSVGGGPPPCPPKPRPRPRGASPAATCLLTCA
jgi:hypothetical protein